MTTQTLGFIGLGNMGAPMASRLVAAGYDVIVHDLSQAAVEALVAQGARSAESALAVANEAETILISLPTPPVVEAVTLGAQGLVHGTAVKRIVDLSTTGPKTEMLVAEGLEKANISLIDCPVSGGVAGAKKGTLALMAAGDRGAFDATSEALGALGRVIYVGPKPGQAQTMKLINNICSLSALAITSEAMAVGAKAGLDADTMIEVLNAGSGRSSATVDKVPRCVLSGSFDFGFPVALSAKDTRLFLDEAERMGIPVIVANAVRQLLAVTAGTFGPEVDMTYIARTLEQWAGTEIRGQAANTAAQ